MKALFFNFRDILLTDLFKIDQDQVLLAILIGLDGIRMGERESVRIHKLDI